MTGSCNVITLNINRIIQDCINSNLSNPEDIIELYNNAPIEYRKSIQRELKNL